MRGLWIAVAVIVAGCTSSSPASALDPPGPDDADAGIRNASVLPPFPVLNDGAWARYHFLPLGWSESDLVLEIRFHTLDAYGPYGEPLPGAVAIELAMSTTNGNPPGHDASQFSRLGFSGDSLVVVDRCLNPMWRWEDFRDPDSRLDPLFMRTNDGYTHPNLLPPFIPVAGHAPPPGAERDSLDFGLVNVTMQADAGGIDLVWDGLVTDSAFIDLDGNRVQVGTPTIAKGVGDAWGWHVNYSDESPFPVVAQPRGLGGGTLTLLGAGNPGEPLGGCEMRRDIRFDPVPERYWIKGWWTKEDPPMTPRLSDVLEFVRTTPTLPILHAFLREYPDAVLNTVQWAPPGHFINQQPTYPSSMWRLNFVANGSERWIRVDCHAPISSVADGDDAVFDCGEMKGATAYPIDGYHPAGPLMPDYRHGQMRVAPYERWTRILDGLVNESMISYQYHGIGSSGDPPEPVMWFPEQIGLLVTRGDDPSDFDRAGIMIIHEPDSRVVRVGGAFAWKFVPIHDLLPPPE